MRTLSPADSELPVDASVITPTTLLPLVVLVGPTAVGKTAMAVRLAEAVGGEIISADSRQIYRGMDIGTAKPTRDEQARIRHHLLDVLEPDETLGLVEYQRLASEAIRDVWARGSIPFLVGGTGQYVTAMVEGWVVPRAAPDLDLRQRLYEQARVEGAERLHARLQALDPGAAERIDPRNVRRVVRALEVCLTTGQPISAQQRRSPPPYRTLIVGLCLPRAELYRRIDARIDAMLSAGLEAEVRRLVSAGLNFDRPAMSAVGYAQFAPYLAGEQTLDETVRQIRRATRRFVRRQQNWFRPDDPRIHWFPAVPDPYPAILALVRDFLAASDDSADPGPQARRATDTNTRSGLATASLHAIIATCFSA